MIAIISVFSFVLFMSFVASLLDGVLVGATVADVELLKKKHPSLGRLFEKFQEHPDKTLSAILGVDTFVSSIGATALGAMILCSFGPGAVSGFALGSTIFSFVFSDILPKTLGVFYRRKLLPFVVWPIRIILWIMFPISYLCSFVLRIFLPRELSNEELSDESLILTAQRGVRDGVLTSIEGQMLEHTLTLDDEPVRTIAQRKIFALSESLTVAEVFRQYPELPYGRIPIYDKRKSNFVGMVRRRDLLKSMAEDRHQERLSQLSQPIVKIPHDATISSALEMLLQHFQQIALVENGKRGACGVVTIEDIFEYIIGRDIFEYDDFSNGTRRDWKKLRQMNKKSAKASKMG